ncbi:hypothetical protein [Streptomyces cucumeris]|uniref:hypothetical protein n=1 Tax=Streptomyces cucumeris TaxID=2962890 RepID=UPI0020C88F6F|nr:hypothetical protein [Streptomyces sp. NEAU-Y11]MCP9209689.1 hypothetical protein [Streptomyces sp. NEAU-Y11]
MSLYEVEVWKKEDRSLIRWHPKIKYFTRVVEAPDAVTAAESVCAKEEIPKNPNGEPVLVVTRAKEEDGGVCQGGWLDLLLELREAGVIE